MMKVFLLCTSPVANSIIYSNSLLFSEKIDCIILLMEIKKYYYSNNKLPVIFYSTLHECISNSDVIVAIQKDSIPDRTLKEAEHISSIFEKPFVVLNSLFHDCQNYFDVNDEKPCILHIFLGISSQTFEGEALLYSVFDYNDIKIKNANSNSMLRQWAVNVLNCNIFRNFADIVVSGIEKYDILYAPVFLRHDIMELRNCFNYINMIKPDYIIVQTDCSYDYYIELRNITRYICNREVDFWIKSRYYNYEEKCILSYQANHIVLPPAKSITDPLLEKTISFEMLSKLAFPNNIKKYK